MGRVYAVTVCVGIGSTTVSNWVSVTTVMVIGTPVSVTLLVGVKVAVTMLCNSECVSETWSAQIRRGLTPSVKVVVTWAIDLVVASPQSVGCLLVFALDVYAPVVVLVGTERHLHAEDMAADTVNAERPAGLATVAALLLKTGTAGGVQVRTEVIVVVGAEADVTVEVVALEVETCQHAGLKIRSRYRTNIFSMAVGVLGSVSITYYWTRLSLLLKDCLCSRNRRQSDSTGKRRYDSLYTTSQ